jgi:hypothetical protein
MVIVRRREFVVVGAGLFWPAATLAAAATCGMSCLCLVGPSLPGSADQLGFLAVGLA